MHAFPLVEVDVANADELLAMVQHGFSVRSTSATGVHGASSRSHAILRVYNHPRADFADAGGRRGGSGAGASTAGGAAEGAEAGEGVLTLVDLAGSEHRIDSMHHTAARRKEGAEINASLMALKNVVHTRAAGRDAEHLFRTAKLTMALKNSFKLPGAKTAVIATVSPASKDTEHSLSTLKCACVMDTREQRDGDGGGGTVRTVKVGEVNVAAFVRAARAGEGPESKANVHSNGNEFGGGALGGAGSADPMDVLSGKKLALYVAKRHRQSERRAFQAMSPATQELLRAARSRYALSPTPTNFPPPLL